MQPTLRSNNNGRQRLIFYGKCTNNNFESFIALEKLQFWI